MPARKGPRPADQAERKQKAIAHGRRLMREEPGLTAAGAASRIARRYDLSPETVRRGLLQIDYRNMPDNPLQARVEQLERLVAELRAERDELLWELKGGKKQFTADEVRGIRQRFRDCPDVSVGQLAREHRVNRGAITELLLGTSYSDIAPELIVDSVGRMKPRKLTVDKAREIRRRYRNREATVTELAAEFNITPGLVYPILNGTSWASAILPGEEPRIPRRRRKAAAP